MAPALGAGKTMLSAPNLRYKNETPPGFAVLTGLLASQFVGETEMRTKEISRDGPVRQAAPHPTAPWFVDRTGLVYGGLKAVSYAGKAGRVSLWNCLCECGSYCVVRGTNLTVGKTTSCGCRSIAATALRNKTHGESKTPRYACWKAMVQRCTNPNAAAYANYGGRGIAVADEFLQYEAYSSWIAANLGPSPSNGHSIDRIDNERGYFPGNLRWATSREQVKNRRCARTILLNGEQVSLADAARSLGLNYYTLRSRIDMYGWSAEKAVKTSPIKETK